MKVTVSDFIGQVQNVYKGKVASKAPAANSEQWQRWLSIARRKLTAWAYNSDFDWLTLRALGAGEVVNGKIDLPSDCIRIIDTVTVTKGTESTELYPRQIGDRKIDDRTVYIFGEGPKQLILNDEQAKRLDGGNVSFAYIAEPVLPTQVGDNVVCDSIEWLVLMVAAELAANDPAKDDRQADLIGQANQEFAVMSKATLSRSKGVPRRATSYYPQIGRSW